MHMKIKKHFNFSDLRKKASEIFASVPDWRQKSKITINIHDAMMSGLACMYFQDPSLLQFQKRLQEEQHRKIGRLYFSIPRKDAKSQNFATQPHILLVV